MNLFKRAAFKMPEPSYSCFVFAVDTLPIISDFIDPDGKLGMLKGTISIKANPKAPPALVESDAQLDIGDYRLTTPNGALYQILVSGKGPEDPYPGSSLPQQAKKYIGLLPDIDAICASANRRILIKLRKPGSNIAEAVLFMALLADQLSKLTLGVISDKESIRYTLPGLWRLPDAVSAIDAREHVVIHLEQMTHGIWAHTHGLLKFGHPEIEMYDLPKELAEIAAMALYQFSQHVIEENAILPNHTVGNPAQPLIARSGEKRREDHWLDAAVIELVDITSAGEPENSGASRGLLALASTAVE